MGDTLAILLLVLLAVLGIFSVVKAQYVAAALCLIGAVLLLAPLTQALS
jgi:hypothetical protein